MYWNAPEQLPTILNALGLTGTAAEIGAGTGTFTAQCLHRWRGAAWHATDTWAPWDPNDWIDAENLHTPEEWDSLYALMRERFAGEPRVHIHTDEESEFAERFPDGSLDLVWLDANGSWLHVTEALARWWPKLRPGGVIGGARARNAFLGPPGGGDHTWLAARDALQQWSRRTGHAHFITEDPSASWIAFNTKLPRPDEILVFTGATSNLDYLPVAEENHRRYCERHGYRYRLFGDADFARDRHPAFSKIKFAREALEESRWAFWIDADCLFNDWTQKLDRLCLEPFGLLTSIWNDHGTLRPSAGTMMLQAGDWSRNFLREVWDYPPHFHWSFPAEENTMKALLEEQPAYDTGFLAVDTRVMNTLLPCMPWGPDDFILHFLSIRHNRLGIMRDVAAMAAARHDAV